MNYHQVKTVDPVQLNLDLADPLHFNQKYIPGKFH